MDVSSFGEYAVEKGGERVDFRISPQEEGKRIDLVLAARLPFLSRSQIQHLIRKGGIRVNRETVKTSYKPRKGDRIQVEVPEPEPSELRPEPIGLDILLETGDFLVLNKPPGLVVHPAPGHETGTLVHALLYHIRDLSGIGGVRRPGIVHRLDKDTSGVLLVAKNDRAHEAFSELFKQGRIRKTYVALVEGTPSPLQGRIDFPIGRHPVQRKRMSIVSRSPKPASTCYEVLHVFESVPVSGVGLRIKTGRTHQIRVHLAALGHPVLGDSTYGKGRKAEREMRRRGEVVERQQLHAWRLEWQDPWTGEAVSVTAPLPEDMKRVVAWLDRMEGGGRNAPEIIRQALEKFHQTGLSAP